MELIEQVICDEKSSLQNREIFIARGSSCIRITADCIETVPELATNHIEADTKLIYLLHHAVSNGPRVCVVRSPSGDTDIPIIILGNPHQNLTVFLDNGTGKNRKQFQMDNTKLTKLQCQALVGLHAFTGNDYLSSFFRKGKTTWWKLIENDMDLLDTFSILGTCELDDTLFNRLQNAVLSVYKQKKSTDVNMARTNIFWNYFRDGRIPDLCMLPPCITTLRLHCERANYVSKMWRNASHPVSNLGDTNGWNEDLSIKWITGDPYPQDVAELLISEPSHRDDGDQNADATDDSSLGEDYDGESDEDCDDL